MLKNHNIQINHVSETLYCNMNSLLKINKIWFLHKQETKKDENASVIQCTHFQVWRKKQSLNINKNREREKKKSYTERRKLQRQKKNVEKLERGEGEVS